jgi:hypothetical protein
LQLLAQQGVDIAQIVAAAAQQSLPTIASAPSPKISDALSTPAAALPDDSSTKSLASLNQTSSEQSDPSLFPPTRDAAKASSSQTFTFIKRDAGSLVNIGEQSDQQDLLVTPPCKRLRSASPGQTATVPASVGEPIVVDTQDTQPATAEMLAFVGNAVPQMASDPPALLPPAPPVAEAAVTSDQPGLQPSAPSMAEAGALSQLALLMSTIQTLNEKVNELMSKAASAPAAPSNSKPDEALSAKPPAAFSNTNCNHAAAPKAVPPSTMPFAKAPSAQALAYKQFI